MEKNPKAIKSWQEVRQTAEREREKPPLVTCPASRHVQIMAERLWDGEEYVMFTEEPMHCAQSLYAVVASLWKARHRIAELESP